MLSRQHRLLWLAVLPSTEPHVDFAAVPDATLIKLNLLMQVGVL